MVHNSSVPLIYYKSALFGFKRKKLFLSFALKKSMLLVLPLQINQLFNKNVFELLVFVLKNWNAAESAWILEKVHAKEKFLAPSRI